MVEDVDLTRVCGKNRSNLADQMSPMSVVPSNSFVGPEDCPPQSAQEFPNVGGSCSWASSVEESLALSRMSFSKRSLTIGEVRRFGTNLKTLFKTDRCHATNFNGSLNSTKAGCSETISVPCFVVHSLL
jgi:hypothetical protein